MKVCGFCPWDLDGSTGNVVDAISVESNVYSTGLDNYYGERDLLPLCMSLSEWLRLWLGLEASTRYAAPDVCGRRGGLRQRGEGRFGFQSELLRIPSKLVGELVFEGIWSPPTQGCVAGS